MPMLDGRRMGDSAVVRRRLRSELVAEDGVSVGDGREGRANGEGDAVGSMVGAVEVWVGCGRMRVGSLASRRKSTHVSPPYVSRG
jgi:hypothetical protein